jgi:2-C-methyl-D-erythritol 4-phosphate cytidylyltransferase
MNIAVIFAGGVGSRMRNKKGPKQFMEVLGKPILAYTLDRFSKHEEIDQIYLVVNDTHIQETKDIIEKFGINKVQAVVAGGETAHGSIIKGIEAAKAGGAQDDDVVIFHDGVRPIIDNKTISQNIETAKLYGNAITSIPAFETVARSVDGETVESVTVRDEMFILQAPQTYRFGDAFDLNEQAKADGIVGKVVDQAELNRHYGKTLYLVDGIRGNVKITVPLDFAYFEFLVESGKYENILDGTVF